MNQLVEPLNRRSAKSSHSRPTKIIQFGEGNFLRAFVDWIVFELNRQTDFDAGVTVVQPLPFGLGGVLGKQNGLYHLILNGLGENGFTTERNLIDVINDVINPYESFDLFLKEAENPELKFIVSNTTEAGIAFDETDSLENQPASSFPGKLLQFLHRRYQTLPDSSPIIILPCELIEENGKKLKETLIRLIAHWELGDYFLEWLEDKTEFCNTLVDRIVPGYPKEKEEEIWENIGFRDELLVEGELFHLWVIEGPQWIQNYLPINDTNLNVVFTDNLDRYRTRKVRILNGLHTTMVPLGFLAGKQTVRETIEDEQLSHVLMDALHNEIIPSLNEDTHEVSEYAEIILNRFKNPAIRHELLTISLNSFSKFKTRVLPSILGLFEVKGMLATNLLTSLACLIRFYRGELNGEPIHLKDEEYVIQKLETLWNSFESYDQLTHEVLSDVKLWGRDLTEIPYLARTVSKKLELIDKQGIQSAITL